MADLLQHMMAPCVDPDCEIHNIEVGCQEGTVSEDNLAFWLAGAKWAIDHRDPIATRGHEFGQVMMHVAQCLESLPKRTLETDMAEDR